jgi:hypothetical protein
MGLNAELDRRGSGKKMTQQILEKESIFRGTVIEAKDIGLDNYKAYKIAVRDQNNAIDHITYALPWGAKTYEVDEKVWIKYSMNSIAPFILSTDGGGLIDGASYIVTGLLGFAT